MATKSLERLIDEFNKLPGIGRKSAARLAFHVLEMREEQVESFIEALREAKEVIKRCPKCGDFCENDLCDICSNELRDSHTICVVEDSRDVISFEKMGKEISPISIEKGSLRFRLPFFDMMICLYILEDISSFYFLTLS